MSEAKSSTLRTKEENDSQEDVEIEFESIMVKLNGVQEYFDERTLFIAQK
jgi:hypothetical protein